MQEKITFIERLIETLKERCGDYRYRYTKNIIQRIIWNYLTIYKKGKEKNIFVFTSGRSGGTWFTEMISTSKGVKYVQEPLSLNLIFNSRKKILYHLRDERSFIDEGRNLKELKKYFDDIIDGKLIIKSPWKVYMPYFQIVTNRIVFKIIMALPLIKWFYDNFNGYFVYFIRHPLAVALSMNKHNFNLEIDGYLRNRNYMSKYWGKNLSDYLIDIRKKASNLEKYLLRWILENIVPYRLISANEIPNVIIVSYEELVTNPLKVIDYLARELRLDSESMKRYLSVSSATTFKKFSAQDYSTDSPLIKGWKKKLSSKTIDKCLNIIERTGVDIYRRDEYLPRKDFLI